MYSTNDVVEKLNTIRRADTSFFENHLLEDVDRRLESSEKETSVDVQTQSQTQGVPDIFAESQLTQYADQLVSLGVGLYQHKENPKKIWRLVHDANTDQLFLERYEDEQEAKVRRYTGNAKKKREIRQEDYPLDRPEKRKYEPSTRGHLYQSFAESEKELEALSNLFDVERVTGISDPTVLERVKPKTMGDVFNSMIQRSAEAQEDRIQRILQSVKESAPLSQVSFVSNAAVGDPVRVETSTGIVEGTETSIPASETDSVVIETPEGKKVEVKKEKVIQKLESRKDSESLVDPKSEINSKSYEGVLPTEKDVRIDVEKYVKKYVKR